MFISIIRVIKFAFQNFWRNIWLSAATISIIILTLLSVNFVGFINVLTLQAVGMVKDRIDISVYFKPEVTPQEVKEIQKKLLKSDKIKDIRYISREDSLKFMKEKYKNDALFKESLDELGTNPLGETLVIKAYDLKYYPLILKALEQSQYKGLVEDRNYEDNNAFLEKIYSVADKIKKFGWIISGIFAIVSILIVFNTIRMAIYTHKEEIGIMKLVGASNWFIRAPFLMESVLYALFGSIFTSFILYPTIKWINPYILTFFDGSFSLFSYYISNILSIWLYDFIGILILTSLTSFLAVGKYLDV